MDKFLKEMTQKCTFDETPPIRKGYSASTDVLTYASKACYTFFEEEEVDLFSSIVFKSHGNPGRNPFILNQVGFQEPHFVDFVEVDAYWSKVEGLLAKFGEHLRELTLSFTSALEPVEMRDQYRHTARILMKCLSLLPDITFLGVEGGIFLVESESDVVTTERRREFLDLVSVLPKCANLTMLDLIELGDPAFVIHTHLLNLHAEQLTQLSLRISEDSYFSSATVDLPRLKDLHVVMNSIVMAETFLSGLKASRQPPKLMKLTLSFSDEIEMMENPLQPQPGVPVRLFNMFNMFASTLRALAIDTYNDNHWGVITFRKLSAEYFDDPSLAEYPLLQSVRISFLSSLSLKFLKNFADSLEELQLRMYAEREPRDYAYPDEILDFYDHIENMTWHKSNIWKVLPRLQFMKIGYNHRSKGYIVKGRTYRNEKITGTTKTIVGTGLGVILESDLESNEDGDEELVMRQC